MRSAAPQNLRSGNARRNSVMNSLTSWRPRRGACSEYCRRMSGVLSSSTTLGFQGLPQNSSNHRATTVLFSCSFDIGNSFSLSLSFSLFAPSVLEIESLATWAHPIPAQIASFSFHIGNDLVTRATTIADEECVTEIEQRLVWPGAREAHRSSASGTDRGPHWWWRIGLVHGALPLEHVRSIGI